MDFLELLKSFGLNLSSVAAALGIDIAALNNMDKDVLLHLLTSQTTSKSWFEAENMKVMMNLGRSRYKPITLRHRLFFI